MAYSMTYVGPIMVPFSNMGTLQVSSVSQKLLATCSMTIVVKIMYDGWNPIISLCYHYFHQQNWEKGPFPLIPPSMSVLRVGKLLEQALEQDGRMQDEDNEKKMSHLSSSCLQLPSNNTNSKGIICFIGERQIAMN